jgi:hypothetical protein
MRKRTKRKVWGLGGPAIRLTELHVDRLATSLHMAAASLDRVECLNQYIKAVATAAAAMAVDRTNTPESDKQIEDCVTMLQGVLDRGCITPEEEKQARDLAARIDEWIAEGRITYRGLGYAKKHTKFLEIRHDQSTDTSN